MISDYDPQITGKIVCTTCNQEKPAREFYNDPRHINGKYSICKCCHIKKVMRNKSLANYIDYIKGFERYD